MVSFALLDSEMVKVCVQKHGLGRVCQEHGQIAIDHSRGLLDVEGLKYLRQTNVGACRVKAQNV